MNLGGLEKRASVAQDAWHQDHNILQSLHANTRSHENYGSHAICFLATLQAASGSLEHLSKDMRRIISSAKGRLLGRLYQDPLGASNMSAPRCLTYRFLLAQGCKSLETLQSLGVFCGIFVDVVPFCWVATEEALALATAKVQALSGVRSPKLLRLRCRACRGAVGRGDAARHGEAQRSTERCAARRAARHGALHGTARCAAWSGAVWSRSCWG